jgi:CRP-like cAMP-binding protein
MVSLDALERVEILEGLNDERLSAVRECCLESRFQRGEKIYGSGEDARHLYAVVEGTVELKPEPSSSFPGNLLQENMVFGWPSLIAPNVYRFSAHSASRSTRLIQMDAECLRRLFEKDPELGFAVMSKLLQVVGSRFHQLQEEVVRRRGQDVMNRW